MAVWLGKLSIKKSNMSRPLQRSGVFFRRESRCSPVIGSSRFVIGILMLGTFLWTSSVQVVGLMVRLPRHRSKSSMSAVLQSHNFTMIYVPQSAGN